MQDLVTPRLVKRKRKISIIPIISCVVAGILFVLIICIVPDKQKNKYFEEKTYYFVYTMKAGKENSLESEKDILKKLGGAGVSFHRRNEYYLLANVYLEKSDAEEIQKGLISSFSEAGMFQIKSKEPDIREIQKIKSNYVSFKFVKFLYELTEKFESKQMGYLSGKISDSEIMAWLMKKKLKLQDVIKELEEEKEECFSVYANLCYTYFEMFFSKFYESTKKQSFVCEFFINIVFCRIQMFDNL